MLYVIELSVFIITVLSFLGVCVLCPIFFFFFFFFFFRGGVGGTLMSLFRCVFCRQWVVL